MSDLANLRSNQMMRLQDKRSKRQILLRPQYCTARTGLIVIAGLYLSLTLFFSQIMHFSRALDEGYHLEYITFIKQHGRLPITYEERGEVTRADFPPLYHLLVAWLSAPVSVEGPPNFKFFWDSFRYRAIDHQMDQVWTIETEDYQWPFRGRFLVWQIGRWISIVLSLATVIVVFFTLQETPLGPKPLLPLVGAGFLAFIPRYIVIGSSLNDDNLLGLVAALYFLALVKALKQPQRWWPFVSIGVLLGLSMTVKYTLVLIPLEITIICGWLAYKDGLGRSWAWRRLGIVGLGALFCSSWWFGWNIWFLNTIETQGWLVGLVRPLLAGGNDTTLNRLSGFFSRGQVGLTQLPEDTIVGTFPQWVQSTFLSFWSAGNPGLNPFFTYIYLAVGLMLIVSGWGLWQLWQTNQPALSSTLTTRRWLVLLIFHTALFFILPLIRFGLTRRLSVAGQGRHILIPAAVAIVGLLVWGLATAIPRRWHRSVFSLILIGFFAWTAFHLYQLNQFNPPPLPMRALPEAATWLPQPVKAQFGDSIELVSYDIKPQPERGSLQVHLAWRSLAQVNENYLLNVSLLNNQGQVVSYWAGYNGQGRLPTLAWDPGDSIFDRLALPLPHLPAGNYTVQVQLIGVTGPLSVLEQGCQEAEGRACSPTNKLSLSQISLTEVTNLLLPQQLSLNNAANPVKIPFALWQADGPGETNSPLSFPNYRYPATISIVTPEIEFNGSELSLQLLDEAGRVWPASQNQARIYTFVIGPRWQSGVYRLQISLQQDGQIISQAVSDPLLTITNWWARQFDMPTIDVPDEANFANQLKFLGYKLPQNQVKAGESFPLTLYWQALAEKSPQANFTQFNHLLDRQGNLHGGYDRLPLEYYSTLLWAPGEVVVDGYAVPVEADAPPGQYYLNVGYYLTVGESAVNLPLVVNGQMTDISSVTIGPIEVVKP